MDHSFTYEGVTITLKQPTGRDRLRLLRLRDLIGYYEKPDDEKEDIEAVLNLLYVTDSIEGDLGFPVPINGNVNEKTVKQFVDGVLDAPEVLWLAWNNAVWKIRSQSYIVQEVDEKKSKPNGSKSDKA